MSNYEITENGRTCSKCKTLKSWDQFDKKSTGVNGKNSSCKTCVKIEKKRRWLKLNTRRMSRPSVLIHTNADLEEVKIPLSDQELKNLDKAFRQLIFQSIIATKE